MKKYKILMWILIIVEMSIIFGFSSQSTDDSVALSSQIAQQEYNLTHLASEDGIPPLDSFFRVHIRSMAHAVLYFILGVLIFIQCRLYGIGLAKALIISSLCCFVYGISDEFHQKFSESRNSCFSDVLIDTAGGFIGSAAGLITAAAGEKRK